MDADDERHPDSVFDMLREVRVEREILGHLLDPASLSLLVQDFVDGRFTIGRRSAESRLLRR